VKRLLTRFAPVAAAALLGVTATLFFAAPASADRFGTRLDATEPVRICPSSGCRSVGTAVSGSVARSYCFVDTYDLIFSEGAPLRLGFVPYTSLQHESQFTSCDNIGFPTSTNGDVNVRDCAISSCIVIARISAGDTVRQFCRRPDAFGNIWIGIFNLDGQRTGFANSTELNGAPHVGLPSC
jgi:hypothetical protein